MLEKVFKKMDQKFDINFSKNDEEERAKLEDYLNMLQYPENDIGFLSQNIFGEKRQEVYRVLYYVLENFEELKKRAYLGYFLVPLNIPDEFMMSEEMKELSE